MLRLLTAGRRLVVMLVVGVSSAAAQAEGLQIAVEAGDRDREAAPVRVRIEGVEQNVVLTGGGMKILGQCAPRSLAEPATGGRAHTELHFVLPKLAAGQTLVLEGEPAPASDRPAFTWSDTPGKHIDLRLGARPVLRYMYEPLDESTAERRGETYKVYHHVFDPAGKRLVTKGPGGLFPHHRGLYYGFNRISYGGQQADVWHCNRGESQQHVRVVSAEAGPVFGRHTVEVNWHGRDGKVFAHETRELSAYDTPGGILIEFASLLRAAEGIGTVKLDGDPQHAGFQFRASQEVPDQTSKQTYYLRPDGRDRPGSFRNWPNQAQHENLPWNALSFVLPARGDLAETRYTCVYLDHPNNPKPARYSERDYGRFGCYFVAEFDERKPLLVNYRVWLQEGEMTVEAAAGHHANLATPVKAKVN